MKNLIRFILLCIAFSSCSREKPEPEVICHVPETLSFSRDIQPLFTEHCATSGCHAGSNPKGKLNLEAAVAYSQLSKPGSGYLDTIQPMHSVLYASMNSTSNPMPPSGKLSNCDLDKVLKWIEQKAKNN